MARPTDWHVLDLHEDPTPGDPYRVRELSRTTRSIADDAESAARNVRGLAGDQATMTWIGAAGDVFKEAIGKFPGQLDKVAHSHHMAADALDAYAGDLDTAQGQADRALAQGRAVYDKVQSLHAQLGTANASLTSLNKPTQSPEPPDPAQVKEQARKHTAAQDQVSSLTSQLSGPQAQLEAAKKLVGQAAELRNHAADTAGKKLHDAANAGIPPDSFWHKLGDLAAKMWHGLIVVAKIVVAVGSIVALIIGGPIAWIVFAAALLVLADTLYEYSQGRASLWDVGLAALSCIPITKGLTTLADLKTAFALGKGVGGFGGGLLGIAGHLGGAGVEMFKGIIAAPMALWKGRSALPGLARALPFTAWGKLTGMATDLRFGVPGAMRGFGMGFNDGSGLFGSIRTGFKGVTEGWSAVTGEASPLASRVANAWQGQGAYIGIDRWSDTVVSAGTQMESLHPVLTGFSAPEGTMASLGGDSAAVSRGVQVGPGDINPDWNILHNYRPEGVTLRFNTDVPAATSHAMANPQFGEGGLHQFFVPDVVSKIHAGDISVVDSAGHVLPVSDRGFVTAGPGQSIPLHNLDLTPGSGILTNSQVGNTVTAGANIKNPLVGGVNVTSLSRPDHQDR